jgi:hypothetical protein
MIDFFLNREGQNNRNFSNLHNIEELKEIGCYFDFLKSNIIQSLYYPEYFFYKLLFFFY